MQTAPAANTAIPTDSGTFRSLGWKSAIRLRILTWPSDPNGRRGGSYTEFLFPSSCFLPPRRKRCGQDARVPAKDRIGEIAGVRTREKIDV